MTVQDISYTLAVNSMLQRDSKTGEYRIVLPGGNRHESQSRRLCERQQVEVNPKLLVWVPFMTAALRKKSAGNYNTCNLDDMDWIPEQ